MHAISYHIFRFRFQVCRFVLFLFGYFMLFWWGPVVHLTSLTPQAEDRVEPTADGPWAWPWPLYKLFCASISNRHVFLLGWTSLFCWSCWLLVFVSRVKRKRDVLLSHLSGPCVAGWLLLSVGLLAGVRCLLASVCFWVLLLVCCVLGVVFALACCCCGICFGSLLCFLSALSWLRALDGLDTHALVRLYICYLQLPPKKL